MRERLQGTAEIGSLGNHPAESLEALRRLLAAGVDARADLRRRNFYEVEDAGRVYYFYVSPVTGKLWLLAVWQQKSPAVTAAPECASCAA